MTLVADTQESLEAQLKGEIIRMYQEIAENPSGEFHFFHGREAAELFGYETEWLDRAPSGAVESFAGVGNPHERSNLQPGMRRAAVALVRFGGWAAGHSLIRLLEK